MNKKTKKKLILAGLAAIASGGIIYAVKKKQEEEEAQKSGGGSDPIVVGPPSGGGDSGLGFDTTQDDIFGGGGSGGGGGGGGGGANMTLCRGLDEEGNEINDLVNAGEACPEATPFSDEIEWDDFLYDSFNCFAYDEENDMVVAQEKDFKEVCAEDYPDFPFETLSSALTYAQDPSAYDGCTDPEALNYDEEAMMDDGSCIMEGDEVQGCTDENALNFDEFANVDDGSCEFGISRSEVINVMEDCDVGVDVAMQVQNMQSIDLIDGVEILSIDEVNDLLGFQCYDDLGQVIQAETEGEPVLGCTDPEAFNYNPEATEDDGSCELAVPEVGQFSTNYISQNLTTECEGASTADVLEILTANADGIVSISEVNDIIGFPCYDEVTGEVIVTNTNIFGCTDSTADNFNPDATEDDGSCIFDTAVLSGCTDPTATNFDEDATEDDGSCLYDVVPQPETKTCYYFNEDAVIMEAYFDLLPEESCWENVDPIYTLADIPTIRNGYFDSYDDALSYMQGMAGVNITQTECAIFDETLPYPDNVTYSPLSDENSTCDAEYGDSIPVVEGQEAQIELYGNAIHEEWLLTQTTLCYGYTMDGVFEQDTPLLSQGAESCTEVGLFDTFDDAESAFSNEFLVDLDEQLVGYIDGSYVGANLITDCPFTDVTDILALNTLTLTDGAYLIDDINNVIGYQCYDPNTGLPDPPPTSDFGCTDSQATNYDPSALIDSGLCQYPDAEVLTEDEAMIPVGIITSSELGEGLNECQNPPAITDILSSLTAETGNWGSGYFIDDVNDIIGYECFDENAQPTGTPPDPEFDLEPADFGDGVAEVDPVMPILEGLTLSENISYCPTFNYAMTAEISANSSVSELNQVLGDTCYDPETGLNLYYDAPAPTSDLVDAGDALNTYLICLGNPDVLDPVIATTLNTAMYPMTASDFNDIIGFPCLDTETGAVINAQSETPDIPSPNGDTTTPQPSSPDTMVSDVTTDMSEDLSSDIDLVGDSSEAPSTQVGSSEADLSEGSSLNSLGQRTKKNFSGKGLQNGGCLDPIALNYDEFAEFDDGTCMY